jgi:hypothetical protein
MPAPFLTFACELEPEPLADLFSDPAVPRALLVAQIHADGLPVETYQFSSIVDERIAGSTLLQRLFGVVSAQSDREVLMLYSSFMRRLGPANLWLYGPDAGPSASAARAGASRGPTPSSR